MNKCIVCGKEGENVSDQWSCLNYSSFKIIGVWCGGVNGCQNLITHLLIELNQDIAWEEEENSEELLKKVKEKLEEMGVKKIKVSNRTPVKLKGLCFFLYIEKMEISQLKTNKKVNYMNKCCVCEEESENVICQIKILNQIKEDVTLPVIKIVEFWCEGFNKCEYFLNHLVTEAAKITTEFKELSKEYKTNLEKELGEIGIKSIEVLPNIEDLSYYLLINKIELTPELKEESLEMWERYEHTCQVSCWEENSKCPVKKLRKKISCE